MNREERILEKLTKELDFKFLEIKNNSNLHKGHLGDDGTMETHFSILIKSIELSNLTRIEAHKKINYILKEEFKTGLHALEIKISK